MTASTTDGERSAADALRSTDEATPPSLPHSFYDPEVVKRLRRRAGLKQATLAQRIKISRAHMCNIENGKVKEPGPHIIAAIARELGCTVADLEREPERPG